MTEKKVAVCTGSGRPGGLGEAILRRLGEEGYRLVVTDVDGSGTNHLAQPDEMASVAKSLRSQGADVLSHACDVRSAESVKQLFNAVMGHFGRVDVLINNAGIGFVMKDTRVVSPDEWNLVIDVTLSGVFHCTQAAAAHMEAAGHGGRIINIGTVGSTRPNNRMPAYYAAKGALANMTIGLAKEVAGSGIGVNIVSPAMILTPEVQASYMEKGMREGWGETWEEVEPHVAKDIPIGRITRREEVANLVAYLCSPLADAVHGQNIRIDGGQLGIVD